MTTRNVPSRRTSPKTWRHSAPSASRTPISAALACDRVGRDAGQTDGGEHETEQAQTGERADGGPDRALESPEVFVHRTSVEDSEPRLGPPQLVADGRHRASIGRTADKHGRPLDRGATEARGGHRDEGRRHRARGEQRGPDVGDHADHDVTSGIVLPQQPASDRRCGSEESLLCRLIDDHRRLAFAGVLGAAGDIALRERAASEERDAERLEVGPARSNAMKWNVR